MPILFSIFVFDIEKESICLTLQIKIYNYGTLNFSNSNVRC